ncbi:MAG: ABC transporter substrate-binding protein [Chloroflexi bacterium]|nr:ABC transporter substrate-binding protein [Chloroflexota bacterium]
MYKTLSRCWANTSRSRRVAFAEVIIALAGLLFAACAPASVAPTPTAAPLVVRTGYVPALPWAPFFVAVEKGYFRERGLDVQLEPIQSTNDAVIQLSSGNYDVAAGGANVSFWNALSRGIKPIVAAPLHSETRPQATPLLISKSAHDSGRIKSVADLKGKKVAVNGKGAAIEYWLEKALNTGGLTTADVDVQVVAFADLAGALTNGSVDAGLATEPFPTLGEDKGLVFRLVDNFVPDFQVTMVYLNPDFARAKPEAAQNVITGYLRGCRDLQGNGWKSDANARAIEKYTKVPADVIKRSAPTVCDPNGAIHIDDFMQLQAFFMKRGDLTYKQPIEFAPLVDGSYVKAALKALGEHK